MVPLFYLEMKINGINLFVYLGKKNKYWGIYYSGVKIDTIIDFLKFFKYPDIIQNIFTTEKENLNYMTFDFGYDFIMFPGGINKCLKNRDFMVFFKV